MHHSRGLQYLTLMSQFVIFPTVQYVIIEQRQEHPTSRSIIEKAEGPEAHRLIRAIVKVLARLTTVATDNMYETREEVDEVQFGNLDAAVDQLIFARSKEQDKMKRDPESRRSGHHSEDQRLPQITEPPRDQTSLHELARVGETLGGNSTDIFDSGQYLHYV